MAKTKKGMAYKAAMVKMVPTPMDMPAPKDSKVVKKSNVKAKGKKGK